MKMRDQITHGIKWVSLSLLLVRLARFSATIVLARLLTPEIFGLVAMANVAIDTIGIVREIGFGAAFIQRKDKDEEDFQLAANTTFAMALVINLILFVVCSASAPFVASFFRSAELEPVLRIMFLTFILNALSTVPRLVLQKRLEFGKLSVSEIVRGLSFAAIAIPLAVLEAGVWSMVAGQIGSTLIFGIVLFKVSGWRPRAEFSWRLASELFRYGKYIWAFAVLSAAGRAVDKAIIGRYWGAANVGAYSLGYNLCNFPVKKISFVVGRISFPAFSKLKDDVMRLKRAYLKTLSHISIVTIPMGFGLIAVAKPLVNVVLGSKWEAVVPLIPVLAAFGMLRSVSAINGEILKAVGKPQILLYTSVVHHCVMILALLLLKDYGVLGICYAVLIPLVISSGISYVILVRQLRFSIVELADPILRPVVSSFFMYAVIWGFDQTTAPSSNVFGLSELIGYVALGVSSYVLGAFAINRAKFLDVKDTFVQVLTSKGKLA